jgi:glycosyltransferase involved in cell wall biosynthesis
MNKPKVSVVIPTYNRAHLIKTAINSILMQTYRDFEIIIADDCSTDNTQQVIKDIKDDRVKYLRLEKNSGSCAARNAGIRTAKTDWVAFLDSDDYWLETKLEKQVKLIPQLSREYAVIHCGIQLVDETNNKPVGERIIQDGTEKEIRNNPEKLVPSTCTMLIRKEALNDVGYFDESLPAHQETELGIRLSLRYKFKLVNEILVKALVNHNQITSNSNNRIRAKEIIIEKHKNVLGKNVLYNFSVIIAGNAIINGNRKKAKEFYSKAFRFKPYNLKPLLFYLFLSISPGLLESIFRKKYTKMGIVKS